MKKGTLYIVATPIGNLKDITLRAIETLKTVNVVLSEDTRETTKLFNEYALDKPQISYRDQNHTRVIEQILKMLDEGQDLALVSDSGTPVLSDPGFKLINDVISAGFDIIPIPGASSITTALSFSGLPTDKFTFLGFLPKSEAQKKKIFLQYGELDNTLIFFESPFRVVKILTQILNVLGDRKVVVLAEMTKRFERAYRGNISEVLNTLSEQKILGEFTILVAKKDYK